MLDELLHKYQPIGLNELNNAALMQRIDKKFLLSLNRLPDLLQSLEFAYYIQEISGKRCFNYDTLYYDTPDLLMLTFFHFGREKTNYNFPPCASLSVYDNRREMRIKIREAEQLLSIGIKCH